MANRNIGKIKNLPVKFAPIPNKIPSVLDEDGLDAIATALEAVLLRNVDVNGTCVNPREIVKYLNRLPTWAAMRALINMQNNLLSADLDGKLEELSKIIDIFAYSTRTRNSHCCACRFSV